MPTPSSPAKSGLSPFWRDLLINTGSTLLVAVGVYFFKFPNNFSFGGVSGIAVVAARLLPLSASTINLVLNMALLALGFIFLGHSFAVKTTYSCILLSLSISLFERIFPLSAPLTDEPMLELIFAILLPALGAAFLFNNNASSGGTDILAMILKKRFRFDIGIALFLSDLAIVIAACLVFDVKTGLYSMVGLLTKTLLIDNLIESINLCKYFNIVCTNPAPIEEYILKTLHRGATVSEATGAFTGERRYIVFTAVRRTQAVLLREFVRAAEPHAFMTITSSSEIIGKGFRNNI